MLRTTALLAAILCSVTMASAQDPATSREETIEAFAEDLAEFQSIFPDSEAMAFASAESPGFWQQALNKATEFRERWRNNPYVEVNGFSFTIGVWPSVSVNFSFKD